MLAALRSLLYILSRCSYIERNMCQMFAVINLLFLVVCRKNKRI